MKKAIIIGASGFIGSHLWKKLREAKFQTIAVQHKRPLPVLPDISVIEGGIKAVTPRLLNEIKPDFIFHCARPTLPILRRFGRSVAARKAADYNQKLIDACKQSNHRPLIVFASGSLMYGNHDQPVTEDFPLNPISFARQYHKGEQPLINEVYKKDYPVMMLRFPWLLGNGSWFKWFYLEQIRSQHAIPLFGDGNNKMHILDLQDAAGLILQYARKKNEAGIFNVFGNEPLSQNEFVNKVSTIFQADIKSSSDLFGKSEKETIEAFTSNIALQTHYPDIIRSTQFTSIDKTLERIKTEIATG